MVRRLLVGVREREQTLVRPHAAEQRDGERGLPTEESGGHGDLRQTRHRTLLARAWLFAVAREPSLVSRGPGLIGRVEKRVEMLAVHQIDELRAEGLAACVEGRGRRAERLSDGRGLESALETARAHGRKPA